MQKTTISTDFCLLCRYVYKRLKWMGNRMLSFAITLTFVSLWHGIWPGYLLNFSMEFFGIVAERAVSDGMCVCVSSSITDISMHLYIPCSSSRQLSTYSAVLYQK